MKDTFNFLKELLDKESSIVIACSGGPDSMCLLHVINSLKENLNLTIICAHVNHGLRIESENEAKFVKDYCDKNNIIFEYMKIEKYKNNKFSEEEGRQKRYLFFESVIDKYKASYLMTAHHGDDLIETILMRIVRGSNLKGYAGINRISKNDKYSILRPLLNLNKEDILKYLKKNDIKYVIDNSNDDEKYSRNRYRKRVLPFLKHEDKNIHLKFLKYSEDLYKNNEYIKRQVVSKIKEIYVDKCVVINKLLECDTYLQEKIIEYIIEDIQKEYIFNINNKQLNSIIKLIKGNNNKEINLANGFIARKSYNKLYIEKSQNNENDNYKKEFKNEIVILDKYKFKEINETKEKSNFVIRLNSEEIKLPLIIRNKKLGDKIKIKNLFGTKKVKDVFINSKIDLKERKVYPIVVDSNDTVLWIPGLKKSIFDKEINEKYDIIIKYGGKYEKSK